MGSKGYGYDVAAAYFFKTREALPLDETKNEAERDWLLDMAHAFVQGWTKEKVDPDIMKAIRRLENL